MSILLRKPLALTAAIALSSQSASAQTFGYQNLNPVQQRHVSGLLAAELGPGTSRARTAAPLAPAVTVPQTPGPNGCPAKLGSNVKVNQN